MPFVFVQRLNGRSPPNAFSHNFSGQNSGLRTDDRAAFDSRVIAYSDLSADHAIVFDNCASRNSCLCGDNDSFADLDVVRDLHEIVNLCSFADSSFAECAAVNTGICADLDIIFDDNRADLREFHITVRTVADIAETVRTDDNAGMQNHIISDCAVIFDKNIWMKNAVFADFYVIADLHARSQIRSCADFRIFADTAKRADKNIFFNLCVFRDNCRRMTFKLAIFRRMKFFGDFSKSKFRIFYSYKSAGKFRIEIFGNEQTRRFRFAEIFRRFYFFDKRNLACRRIF